VKKAIFFKDLLIMTPGECQTILNEYAQAEGATQDLVPASKEPPCMQLTEYIGAPITGEEIMGEHFEDVAPEFGMG
jgi:hypothetical protein